MADERLMILVGVLALGLMGCADRDPPVPFGSEAESAMWMAADDVETVEPVPYQVFLREPASESDPARAIYHLLVPPGAGGVGLHRAMTEFLQAEADRDHSLVAIRVIAYVSRPTNEREASLIPVMWAEWVPPEGWGEAGPTRSRGPYRIYTYQEIPPEW